MVKTTEKKANKKVCEECKSNKNITEYYNADKMFFTSGKLHICKECSLKIVEENGHEGLLGLLRMLNKPFYVDLYKQDVGDYIRMMNSMPQYRKVTFLQSDSLSELTKPSGIKRAKPKELTEEELRDSEDYWGLGYTEQDYQFLNTELSEYGAQYDITGKAMENLIREICLTQLDIRNKRSSKQDVKNDLKTLQDLLGSSNLKPMQESGSQAVDQESFGTLIKKYENERPIPEPSPEWADVDGIGKYIRTFFLGHMAKMFNKENKFQQEYDEIIGEYTVNPRKEEDD